MVDNSEEKGLLGENQNGNGNCQLGLSTEEELERLRNEIQDVLESYEKQFEKERLLTIAKNAFAKPYESPLTSFLLLIFLLTIILVVREGYLRRTEIYRKTRLLIDDIDLARKACKEWTIENYPNVCSPMSPCVTLQWTYRDGRVINLPWALLVKDDVIVIRPGSVAPGDCTELNGKNKFRSGETYGLPQPTEVPVRPTVRQPLPDILCTLDKTPFLDNLTITLEKALKRPSTIYNQQRHLLITKYIQQRGVIVCLTMTLFFAALHYNDKLYDDRLVQLKWMNLFIELPLCAILPVIPMTFPVMWIAINLWGVARLQTYIEQPDTIAKTEQQKSFQEDLDTPTFECENVKLPFKEVFCHWLRLFNGESSLLPRSSNVVQVLGSVTALCCVDKKGILSWPNPTAEKVFFLRDSEDRKSNGSEDSIDSDECKSKSNQNENKKKTCEISTQTPTRASMEAKASVEKRDSGRIIDTHKHPGTVAEVLDLTHDQCSPFRIDFDDHSWKKYIDSLKPLGLAILMNTCCQKTQEHYSKFCAHVTAVATVVHRGFYTYKYP